MYGGADGLEVGVKELSELLGISGSIVLAADEGVFEGNSSTGAIVVAHARLEKILYLPLVVDGHNSRALLIGRRMERDGERDRNIDVCELVYAGDDTAGGKRYVSVTDIEASGEVNELQKLDYVVKIIERLTDAHHNNVRHSLTSVARCGDDLTEKLGGEEVTHLTTDGGGAEATSHTASNLAGDTEGVAVLISHKYALDALTVVKAEEVLDRAVDFRGKLRLNARESVKSLGLKSFAQFFRQVGHLGQRCALCKTREYLLCSEFRLAE